MRKYLLQLTALNLVLLFGISIGLNANQRKQLQERNHIQLHQWAEDTVSTGLGGIDDEDTYELCVDVADLSQESPDIQDACAIVVHGSEF